MKRWDETKMLSFSHQEETEDLNHLLCKAT